MVVTTRAVADEVGSSKTVAPVSVSTDPSAARKRRREKLASQRQSQMTPPAVSALGESLPEHVVSAASSNTTTIATSTTTTTVEEEEEAAAAALLDATLLDDVLPLPLTVESSGGMDLDMDDLMMASSTSASDSLPSASALPKRRRVSNCLKEDSTGVKALVVSDATCNKKPQMKYDPPPEMAASMSKEEAALWRREQRRKRNRESAAASRQRQRSRIAELECELFDWKGKVQSVLDRIASLEAAAGLSASDVAADVAFGVPPPLPPHVDEAQLQQDPDPQDQDPLQEQQEFDELVAGAVAAEQLLDVVLPVPPVGILTIDIPPSSKFVSPPASPGRSSPLSSDDESSPTPTLSTGTVNSHQGLPGVVGTNAAGQRKGGTGEITKAKEHIKMISRHAVS